MAEALCTPVVMKAIRKKLGLKPWQKTPPYEIVWDSGLLDQLEAFGKLKTTAQNGEYQDVEIDDDTAAQCIADGRLRLERTNQRKRSR